jgi:hypothetical protein
MEAVILKLYKRGILESEGYSGYFGSYPGYFENSLPEPNGKCGASGAALSG